MVFGLVGVTFSWVTYFPGEGRMNFTAIFPFKKDMYLLFVSHSPNVLFDLFSL